MKFIEISITEGNNTQTSLVNVNEILSISTFDNETFIQIRGYEKPQKINESYNELKNKLV